MTDYFNNISGELDNQSGVVIQTSHDIADIESRLRADGNKYIIYPGEPHSLDPATIRIDINDLVFRVGTSKVRRHRMLGEGIAVTSFLNGYALPKQKARNFFEDESNPKEEEQLQAISESIRFIGQALGATVPNPENEGDMKLQFTTRVQGNGHILNTGTEHFSPGDIVLWDLFTKSEINNKDFKKRLERYGFGPKKIPLKTIPLTAAHNNFSTAVKKYMVVDDTKPLGTLAEDMTKSNVSAIGRFSRKTREFALYCMYIGQLAGFKTLPPGFPKSFKEWRDSTHAKKALKLATDSEKAKEELYKEIDGLVEAFMILQDDLKRREIGKVLSYAAPGKGMDVLLGSH